MYDIVCPSKTPKHGWREMAGSLHSIHFYTKHRSHHPWNGHIIMDRRPRPRIDTHGASILLLKALQLASYNHEINNAAISIPVIAEPHPRPPVLAEEILILQHVRRRMAVSTK